MVFPTKNEQFCNVMGTLNGTIGLIIFILSYYFFGRHHGTKKESWG